MPVPAWTDADLASALSQHLPTGRAWPRNPQTVQAQTIAALAPTFERLCASAAQLLIDGFPSTTVDLLPEWQESLGLPDPCAGPAPTLALSEAQVVARFTAGGGQSIPYFKAFAAILGFTIVIEQYVPFAAGRGVAGAPLYGQAWVWAWTVKTPAGTTYENAVLECEINRLAPAQSVVIFDLT